MDDQQRAVKESLIALRQLCTSSCPSRSLAPFFSRALQRKLGSLLQWNISDAQGPVSAVRLAFSLIDVAVSDLIHCCQSRQNTTVNLWAAVRSHGCQFLGPAMQEEVLRLILLALEDGSSLSRKVLILFVVQRLQVQYPQVSKTAVGHVVQLLYRASCFNVMKRDQDSSLMQLKEEFRTYEALRYQHDMQIVEISLEFGLRIGPDQWSSLLYGDNGHKSLMHSIIDKLSRRQGFVQNKDSLLSVLKKSSESPEVLEKLEAQLDSLASLQQNFDSASGVSASSWSNLDCCLKVILSILKILSRSLQQKQLRRVDNVVTPKHTNSRTGSCPQKFPEQRSTETSASEAKTNSNSEPSSHPFSEALLPVNDVAETSTELSHDFSQLQLAQPQTSRVVDSERFCHLSSSSSNISVGSAPSHMTVSSCQPLSYNVLPQHLLFHLPVGMVADSSESVSGSGNFCHTPVILPFHQASPSGYVQPMSFPADFAQHGFSLQSMNNHTG